MKTLKFKTVACTHDDDFILWQNLKIKENHEKFHFLVHLDLISYQGNIISYQDNIISYLDNIISY